MSLFSEWAPNLRADADVQVQTAFSDHNWPQAVRLADRKHKATKDPYYEIVKICAASQLDGDWAKTPATLAAADRLNRAKTVPDLDTIELLDWATSELDFDYGSLFGSLRVKWVKANPKHGQAVQCLRACIEKLDMAGAQKMAAVLDKAHTAEGDRRYMFWNMTLTYLFALDPTCPDEMRGIYEKLALKQLERAAELTETTEKPTLKERCLLSEDEVYLYYRVLRRLGTREKFGRVVAEARIGALRQLRDGRKSVFLFSLEAFEQWRDWDTVFDLCHDALDLEAEDGSPLLVAADWRIWKSLNTAAKNIVHQREDAFDKVHGLLAKLHGPASGLGPMFAKTMSLATLDAAFSVPDSGPSSTRLTHLALVLNQLADKASTFDDIKAYASALTAGQRQVLQQTFIPSVLKSIADRARKAAFRALVLKLEYLFACLPQTQSAPSDQLQKVMVAAMDEHGAICCDASLVASLTKLDRDPRIDLALVIGSAMLKLAGIQKRHGRCGRYRNLGVDASLLLAAALVLDQQLKRTPDAPPLRLLLVQLYLLLGCVSYAHRLWEPLGVKRATHTALSPLFCDRLATLSPSLVSSSDLMLPIMNYYHKIHTGPAPPRLWDAFASASYGSIVDVMDLHRDLRRSCTAVMARLEGRRADRACGARIESDLGDDPFVGHLTASMELVDSTDHGSFPNLEPAFAPALHELVSLGPALTTERCHLTRFAEQYLDLLAFQPAKTFKPARPGEAARRDFDYLVENLCRIESSLNTVLHRPHTALGLTVPENTHFTIVTLLCTVLATHLTYRPCADTTTAHTAAATPPSTAPITLAIQSSLSSLPMAPPPSHDPVLFALTDTHAMALLRSAALAAKQTAAFALSIAHKEAYPDLNVTLPSGATAEWRSVDAAATKALGEVKGRLVMLTEAMARQGWLDRLLGWTFGLGGDDHDEVAAKAADMVGGRAGAEEWAASLLESWRDSVKGWGLVRMEV